MTARSHSASLKKSRPVKLPFALLGDRLLHISEIPQSGDSAYHCPGCGGPVIPKKGAIKRHHFGHFAESTNCGETALHQTAMRLIHDGISLALRERRDITLAWPCSKCSKAHERPLLTKATSIVMEQNVGSYRPDLVLYDAAQRAIAVIEVIVSHDPEPEARRYYQAQRIGLIEYGIETEADVERLRNLSVLRATATSVCLTPKCGNCGGRIRTQRILYAIEVACPNSRCRRPMKVGFRQCGQMGYPRELNESEVALLKNRGVQFGSYSNRTFGTRNRTCVCLACGRAPSESQYRGDYWYKVAGDKAAIVLEDEVCSKCFSTL